MVMRRVPSASAGASLIEILVAVLILAFGLLGLAGLQSRVQSSEMEAYQRSQALLLVKDMANRLSANRSNAADYAAGAPVSNPLGAGQVCAAASTDLADRDLREWCDALQGAGETLNAGANRVGTLIGGRGCVELRSGTTNEYQITVTWQGLTPLSIASDSSLCGGGTTYDTTSAACSDNRCRRAVTSIVRIGTL